MLSNMTLSTMAQHCYAECHLYARYAECCYAEFNYTECNGTHLL
jgi:hypothetical protein